MSASAFSSNSFARGFSRKDVEKISKARKAYEGKPFVKCSMKTTNQTSQKTVRVGVLGASGYTGSEVLRLLANHPQFGVAVLTADRKAGQPIASVFPHLGTQNLPDLVSIKDVDFSDVDAVFCCLPHGTTQEIIKGLPKNLKIVDLSADFRLRDISEYEEWYGQPHRAPDLQKEVVYGLTEISREEIKNARLVANPGGYLLHFQKKDDSSLYDKPSFSSGKLRCRSAKESLLFTEVTEGIYSYGVTRHRHVPETEQGLSDAAFTKITISFTPHLIPMTRGMQSTIYVEMAPGVGIEELYQHLKLSYEDEEFVVLLEKGIVPRTHSVKGTNYCLINVFPDRIPGRAIVISVIDNLMKGASVISLYLKINGVVESISSLKLQDAVTQLNQGYILETRLDILLSIANPTGKGFENSKFHLSTFDHGSSERNRHLDIHFASRRASMLSKMATSYPSYLVSTSARFQPLSSNNFVRTQSPFLQGFKITSCFVQKRRCSSSASKKTEPPKISCAMDMSAQHSDDDSKIKLDHLIDKVQKLWDSSPQPVKNFPWNKALENFIQLTLNLILAVVKYLSVPLLAVSSLSELSYCAHERRLFLVPFPVIFGAAVAAVLKGTALELSPRLKNAEAPWHLIAIAIFFTLIKLPGPYYPYWGRILVPHFANGVLWRTLWFAILWYRRPQKALKMPHAVDDRHSTY
ncbi:hypothetical protein L6164_031983 [Bauhinia variegata]|uniref:Uncharacterized protein n=1 Tax=Bauhinia variegata TaxID=167791 RepID=A0ACB9KM98_BAUVA|nr:hypothetical protein L6164_031983 [Bauhinia variegata]